MVHICVTGVHNVVYKFEWPAKDAHASDSHTDWCILSTECPNFFRCFISQIVF